MFFSMFSNFWWLRCLNCSYHAYIYMYIFHVYRKLYRFKCLLILSLFDILIIDHIWHCCKIWTIILLICMHKILRFLLFYEETDLVQNVHKYCLCLNPVIIINYLLSIFTCVLFWILHCNTLLWYCLDMIAVYIHKITHALYIYRTLKDVYLVMYLKHFIMILPWFIIFKCCFYLWRNYFDFLLKQISCVY